MIRLPHNHSCFRSDKDEAVVRYLRPSGAYVVEGYGPSYGIDDHTLSLLQRGGKIAIPGFEAWLVMKKSWGTVGPIHQSYPIYWVRVEGPEADQARQEAARRESWKQFCRDSQIATQLHRLGGIVMDEFGYYRFITAPCLGPVIDREGNVVAVKGYWSPRTIYRPIQYPAVDRWLRGEGVNDIPLIYPRGCGVYENREGWVEV